MSSECVGDSSKDVLGNLQRTAKVLFQKALLSVVKEGANYREPQSLDDLISERDQLHLERLNLEVEVEFRNRLFCEPLSDTEVNQEDKRAEEQVGELEEQLLSLKLQCMQDNKLLECLRGHEFLTKKLFLKDCDSNSPQTVVQKSVHQQTELASELLYNVKELEKLRKELLLVKKERVRAQCQCRKLMEELQGGKDGLVDSTKQDSDVDSILQKSLDEVILLRHTLLCLIGGSGVDWSRDEQLCDLVTNLGQ